MRSSGGAALLRQAWRSTVVSIALLLALLFVPAGTLAYWQAWVFAAVFLLSCAAFAIDLARRDPAALGRRMQAGPGHEREPAQKVIMAVLTTAFVAELVVPGLDRRFAWSAVPWPAAVLGEALVVLAFVGFRQVLKVNSFAGANIRVEAGQPVISSGPYARVRHPMYSAALVLILAVPVALGSYWGLLVAPLFLPALASRIVNEEQVLLRDLPGYGDYLARVRWRLVPGIW